MHSEAGESFFFKVILAINYFNLEVKTLNFSFSQMGYLKMGVELNKNVISVMVFIVTVLITSNGEVCRFKHTLPYTFS